MSVSRLRISVERLTRRGKGEQGSVLLESAIAFPLLAVILFAFIQWGIIFAAHLTVRNAAEVAARTAVLNEYQTSVDDSQVESVAKASVFEVLDQSHLVVDDFDGSYPLAGAVTGKKVELSYNLPLILPFVVPGSSGGNFTVKATAVMY